MSYLFLILILLPAFIVNAFAGFGGGLAAVPFLVLLFPLTVVAPLINILGFLSNTMLVKTFHKFINWNVLIPLVVGNAIGSIIGFYFLTSVQNHVLTKILGVIIILAAFNILIVRKNKFYKPNIWIGSGAGILSGVLSSLFATGGPPLVLYLSSVIPDKSTLRATSLAFLLINGIVQVALVVQHKLFSMELFILLLIGFPVLLLANWIGHHLHVRASETVFRRVLFGILVFSGIMLLIK